MRPSLAPLRFPADRSRGRRYDEAPHSYRDEFQRDRDRIVHSRAFRRLEDKTQVFAPALSDHFRNRLTHTIEVAQIARTVAAALELNEHLTEALALAHDIGHPPFAHAGEEALDRQMNRFGDGFDHNLHALRIVESFELRYAGFPGLNLSFEVREGIVKHSRDFAPGEFPLLDEYLPGLRPPLEAQLIDLADEIAYNTADLDDAFSAGMFTMDDIAREVPEYAELAQGVERLHPAAPERLLFHETLRRLIDLLVSGLIDGTRSAAAEHGLGSVGEVRACPRRVASFTPLAARISSALKDFLRRRVYCSAELLEGRRRVALLVGELFQFFLDHPDELPPAHRSETRGEAPQRLVCDYIAGMTDGFFRRTYRRLLENGG
ncbi:MAG: deoxyguanosinetriphosphate triphosphohydrolase [Bryobacteraceae bacterium]